MSAESDIEALHEVEYLKGVDEETLHEVVARAERRTFSSGSRLVSELESGADVYVLLSGTAEVTVEGQQGEREVLGTLKRGSAFGEMSSLTGELRSATVIAKSNVEALVISDADFDELRERRPQIAVALVRMLAKRIADADKSVAALLDNTKPLDEIAPKTAVRRGSLWRVWQELVAGRGRDLAFLALASFVITLLSVRAIVFASFHFEFAPRDVLRTLYMTGFGLVLASSAVALLTFRPGLRRVIAILYGIGGALIVNELGVTLAFDIFYKDIHHADPNVAFDVERLYRRTEPLRAILIGLLVLIQAAYLRTFYSRAFFILRTRLRKALSRSS